MASEIEEPPDVSAQAAAARLRALGFTVRWDGEFWLIRDDRGEPGMSSRATRGELLLIASEASP